MANSFNNLVKATAGGIKPLGSIIAVTGGAKSLINGLGWQLPPTLDDIGFAVLDLKRIIDKLDKAVNVSPDDRNNEIEMIARYVEVAAEIGKLVETVENIVKNFPALLTSDYLNKTQIVEQFLPRLLQSLTTSYLAQKFPVAFAAFKLMGLIDVTHFSKDDSIFQHEHIRIEIRFDRIPKFFSSEIKNLPDEIYGWGTPGFNHELFIGNISALLLAFNGTVKLNRMDSSHESILLRRTLTPEEIAVPLPQTYLQLYKGMGFDFSEIGLLLYSIRKTATTANDGGIGLMPLIKAGGTTGFDLHPTIPLRLDIEFNVTIDQGIAVKFLPSSAPVFDTSFFTNPTVLDNKASLGIKLKYGNEQTKFVLLSVSESLQLWFRGTYIKAGINYQNGNFEPFIEFGFEKGALQIGGGQGDGFLQKIFPGEGFLVEFNIAGGWSKKVGFYFTGSGSLEIQLPVHISIGPISLEGLTASIQPNDAGLKIALGADIKASLGPLVVIVKGIGLSSNFTFPDDNKGNLGFLNASLGFKPPDGLSLSINAGAVIGGGYLFFDFEKEEYAGVLELTIAGFISAKAIGLITTKMPDGSKGFSMLIIITAEFMPPFQLSYGFTLIGVGGLLGLNRTVLLDPLRDAVRTGAVTSIMFPQNVIANAPRIISDLKTIFPPYEGKFLIGPMAKLGWGTPTLISLSLGLIIEIPGNIAILGILKIALPEERIAIVQIQVLFVGTIDFDKKMLTFDASLYESFILTMTIEGDMAVRLKWGDNPDFLLSVGGFHPSYTPPPLALPTLRRLAINILNTDIAKIRVECYQAITSNTVQFGARADVFFDVSVCSITGFISFDALFQFSPFYFIIEVAAGFSLKAAGISVMSVRVRMSLEGPTPWRAMGTGSVSFFFFDISADFDVTWGEEKNTALPDIAILQTFIDEINKKELWSTALSSNKNLLVSLRKFNDATEAGLLVMHPAGSLIVQQKLLPLKVRFDKIGNQKTSDVQKITITAAHSSGEPLAIKDVDENFARAQYQKLSDAEKLSKPSFEKMPGGVRLSLGAATIKNGKLVRKKVKYEITIIDKEPVKRNKRLRFAQMGVLFANFLKGNSVSKSVLSKNYAEKLQPFNEKMNVLEEGYTVAFQSNNKAYTTSATFSSEMMAQTFMQEQIIKNPSLQKEVHIISNYELQIS